MALSTLAVCGPRIYLLSEHLLCRSRNSNGSHCGSRCSDVLGKAPVCWAGMRVGLKCQDFSICLPILDCLCKRVAELEKDKARLLYMPQRRLFISLSSLFPCIP